MLFSIGLTLLAAMGNVAGAAVGRRGTIASDEIVGFPQTVPDNATGQLYLKYKPFLKVVNGCVPFPAVDAEGNTK